MQDNKLKVLIVEDEPDMAQIYASVLKEGGYEAIISTDSKSSLEIFHKERPAVVLTDLKMPDIDGMEILKRIRAIDINVPVIMITGFATIESAVEAMKIGANDFLAKPFPHDELILKIKKAIDLTKILEENIYLRQRIASEHRFDRIIGQSNAIKEVLNILTKVYESDSRVLITGESGTGKEVVARSIHYNGLRRNNYFFPVNCAALSENLLESELFGHEKGAFTGAISTKKGLFEITEGGTLFLDEIGDTTFSFQAKLLRVIQENEFKRVGGDRILKSDVRVIASSNKDLKKTMLDGRFREDLFYRLNVIHIHLLPLRERKEDIPLLVEHLLEKHCFKMNKKKKNITDEAMEFLKKYDWPGNIRELENVLERALIMTSEDSITIRELAGISERDAKEKIKKPGSLEALEKELIEKTLLECNFNKTLTAERLGIGRRTLYEKAARFGISLDSK
ncbi:MAG: hypothetical protein A3C43_09680 [Candidatus Schekmanbacteria bacterium RIFCSPHIGHO2_02_FULL_38_11]|uniref:Sigma-54-dependent Fis family transcriptional regulator n=1 Tax=Candidatus Schekmanbacteria bacterium RIFCSPLOWO2_12_FULL_38_15 TaxID=1817883 RepID=A0A1F7SF95_9BACT|nr:MAG: hypothetical protein A3C43_09680 [Candidatus Schekmanbacteria bacterium RIFCSPHIGHO2_02_FULL_38_11]OGL51497.1 MAG: hypothetical protein A3H37_12355 [Candidatus Schekmanbacteria bacterium RIFCSPLOWO2_02_FULL_38_14]OGL51847.1 MAG: hypothetical protein A3G31_12760 [Candidatus Schekmanbacteria bacterium RIFCSPLOWO2_12_FULL_38_15]